MKDKTSSPHKALDPLGTIEHCAKRLWEDKGRKPGTTWEDHFAEAEELLLSGRSNGVTSPSPAVIDSALHTIPPGIWALREQQRDPFAAVLARSVQELLTEHESFCLAILLLENEFKLKSDDAFRLCSDEQIAHILAVLSAEYDEDFVRREKAGGLSEISTDKRAAYWGEKIAAWRAADAPLNYSDRNTIDRLKDTLLRQPEIEQIRLHNA